MAEPGRVAVHRSIFVRLVVVMLVMAASLLTMVALFFFVFVRPVLGEHHNRSLGELTRVLARAQLGPEEAAAVAARLDMPIRYEGPAGAWATSDVVPTVAQARAGAERCVVQPAPDGGAYVFRWEFLRPLEEAHTKFVVLQLGLIVAVVLVAHWTLSRALRPLRDLQGGVTRLSEGDLDVVVESRTKDELGALTDAFNGMARRVRDMVRARDQLLLDVSHELRSPITRMKVALELLPPGEKTTRLLLDVGELEAMVNELLELERLRDGRAIDLAPVDLVPLLRDVAASFADRAPGVRFEPTADRLEVPVDAAKLRRALGNVIENAVKYSLPDSQPVVLRAERRGDVVELRVIDDGPGIPDLDLPRLFEPFFRVDRSRSKKTGGFGLGLSLCRRILQAHGGEVVARNNDGRRGATFVVTIPLAQDRPPSP